MKDTIPTGADVLASHKGLCTAASFESRAQHPLVEAARKRQLTHPGSAYTEDEAMVLVKLTQQQAVRHETVTDIDDPTKHLWVELNTVYLIEQPAYGEGSVKIGTKHFRWGDSKFGRIMVCLKTGMTRTQTMGEFYQSATVD